MFCVGIMFSDASQQSNCGEMSVDLQNNRKHLHEILECIHKNAITHMEADVSSYVSVAA